ncbi:hypothetical protein KPH14_011888 [Odynerus spinipes]|uniref:Endonuclease/exonuclease/phosphatase domain-containing protein n=1 Tax=Odynerus spinipes TaxID=1348599 RepID=A0AAD9R9M4_9HYME|nr:hypothetical protein KPH14_011888 [Odynerus spinipes]
MNNTKKTAQDSRWHNRFAPLYQDDGNTDSEAEIESDSSKEENKNQKEGKKQKDTPYSSTWQCVKSRGICKEDYNKLIEELKKQNIKFHIYTNKTEKRTYVVRGLYDIEDTTEIKEELEKVGIQVANIGILKGTVRTLLMITIKGTTNINQLQQQVQYLNYTKIKWEYYINPACLKCAGEHLTKDCKKPRTEPAKCVNCGGDHPANATICKKDIEITKDCWAAKSTKLVGGSIQNIAHLASGIDESSSQPDISDLMSLTSEIERLNSQINIKRMLENFMNRLRICTWNANGIRNKKGDLIDFLSKFKIDIMLINETKLSTKDVFAIRNYNIERVSRDNIAGGVALLVKNTVAYKSIKRITNNKIEHVSIKLGTNVHIIAVYNRPANWLTSSNINSLMNIGHKVLLVGDLNARHKAWNCHINNKNGRTLYNYIQRTTCSVLYTGEPTLYPDNGGAPTIDLIINNRVNCINEPIVINELNSDHLPVLFELNGIEKSVTNRKVYTSIDEEVSKLTENIKQATRQIAEIVTLKRREDRLPEEIIAAIKDRNRHRRLWLRIREPRLKDICKYKTNRIKQAIIEYKNKVCREKLQRLNTHDKTLWKATKIFKKKYSPIPILENNNREAYTDRDKAEMFANIAEDVQNYLDEDTYLNEDTSDTRKSEKYLTTSAELKQMIKYLLSHKAPGDQIQNIVLKDLSRKTIAQLMYIINAIIKLQYFPQSWKIAKVIPILKPGKPSSKPSS